MNLPGVDTDWRRPVRQALWGLVLLLVFSSGAAAAREPTSLPPAGLPPPIAPAGPTLATSAGRAAQAQGHELLGQHRYQAAADAFDAANQGRLPAGEGLHPGAELLRGGPQGEDRPQRIPHRPKPPPCKRFDTGFARTLR